MTGPSDHSTPSPHFSIFWTLVSVFIVVACIGMIVWHVSSHSPLDRVEDPEKALERLVSRSMEFEYALTRVSPWEQWLTRLISGDENVLHEAMREYQELAHYSNDPRSALYLAVLEAQTGHHDDVEKIVQGWKDQPPGEGVFKEFLQAAYLEESIRSSDIDLLQARLAEEIPDGWFYSRLAIELARKKGDADFELLTQQSLDRRAHQLLVIHRTLLFSQLGVCVAGLFLMATLIRRRAQGRSENLRVGECVLPPLWSIQDGFAVMVRGGAITALLLFGLSVFGYGNRVIEFLGILVLYCPILALAYYYLFLPHHVSVVRALGLHVSPGSGKRLLSVFLVLWAAGLLGDWAIGLVAGAGQHSAHWTEWFNQSLVWGTPLTVVVTVFEFAVLAPVLEEAIFRGVLFGTLRRRFGWELSAVLSAAVFSAVHGYGLVGFLTVFWSGLLWAWAYEKTGSLWPGVVAHAVNNLLVSMTLVALFR